MVAKFKIKISLNIIMVDNIIGTCFIIINTAVVYNGVPKLPIRYAAQHNIILLCSKTICQYSYIV